MKSDHRGFVKIPLPLLQIAGIADAAEFIPIETLKGNYWRIISAHPSDDDTHIDPRITAGYYSHQTPDQAEQTV